MGLYSSVLTGIPHREASAPLSRLSGLNNDFIYISSFVQELNGLDFKRLVCEVFDEDELKETREDSEISNPSQFRFSKTTSNWLESGKFETYVVTQSSDANMSDELKGESLSIEASYLLRKDLKNQQLQVLFLLIML
jgi:hypothetical protein